MKTLIVLFIALLIAVGCSNGSDGVAIGAVADTPGPTPTETNTPSPTNTPRPTSTPRPTNTPEPTPTCSERHGDQFVEQLQDVVLRWNDAVMLADSTPRMALAGPLAELQEVRREALAIDVPDCAAPAHDELILFMEGIIDGFLSFLGDDADAIVTRKFDDAFDHFRAFLDEMEKIGVEDFDYGF